MLDINSKRRGETLIVHIKGELDHNTASDARETLTQLIEDESIKNMVIDLSALNFMDSSGIGILLGRYKRMHHMGGEVLVTGEDAKIRRLLRISGVYQVVGTL